MSYLGNEETLVELPALEYMEHNLGYEVVHGKLLTPETGERESFSEAILSKRLSIALKRLNPWMNQGNLIKCLKFLSRPENMGSGLIEINERIYEALVDLKFTVEQDLDGSGMRKHHTVHFLDYENTDNNDFLAVRQFELKTLSGKSIFPDLVIFVNGIPVSVIECKSPFLEKQKNQNTGKKEAFEQLRRYMNEREGSLGEGNPRLFYTNFFTGIFNKYHAYAGTISSKYSHYLEWKDPYPFAKNDISDLENNGQNLFIQGLLEKANLLDVMRNFILFEGDSAGIVKKIARYQQFRAVNKAIDRLKKGKEPLERGGVIWHTQGSGKSLTMVMLARKIKRSKELSDATIVVVTDRVDLDKQIYGTFVATLSKITTIERADKISTMKELLSQAQAKIIMTTIQKFESDITHREVLENGIKVNQKYVIPYEILTTKSNVIVLSDEAHRSQYKDTASNMRTALPYATFIGFTGTPVDKDDKSTPRTFGGYIDKYGIKEAVDDGATVRIVYEGRMPQLHISDATLDELFDEEFEDRTQEEREAIKQRYANKQAIVESTKRINDIARDILKHYKDNILPNGFKAQIVCVSREASVRYFNAIKDNMKEIIGHELEAKVIFSGTLNDKPHLKEHFTTKAEQEQIIDRFKRKIEDDKLCFLIVKDMLLTGFDAPIEQVMYLDRPLKEHNLLQAIARVNRTHNMEVMEKDKRVQVVKQCGYVVDYYGVSDYLQQALEIFDKDELGEPMESISSIYNEMRSYREDVMRIFTGKDKDNLDELVRVLEPEDTRAKFEIGYKKFCSAVEMLMPSHIDADILNDVRWLGYIKAAAKARYAPTDEMDITDAGEKVRRIIEEHLESKGVIQWIAPITLFDSDFDEKINSLLSDESKASTMEHTIRHTLHVKMKQNPVFYTSLLEKLQGILAETINDFEERRKRLEEFIHNDVEQGIKKKSESLGLDESEFAFFEVVRFHISEKQSKDETVAEDEVDYLESSTIELSKNIAMDVKKVVEENYIIDWIQSSTKTASVERAIYMKLNMKYFKDIKLDVRKQMVSPLLDLAKRHFAEI